MTALAALANASALIGTYPKADQQLFSDKLSTRMFVRNRLAHSVVPCLTFVRVL